jgi:PEGA domain
MSTESSAVVRFITLAQQEHQTIQDSSTSLPDFTDDLRPLRRSYKVPLLVLGVLLFAAAAAMAGVYVGKHYFGAPADKAQAVAPAPAPASGTAAPAPGTAPAPTPSGGAAAAGTAPAPAAPSSPAAGSAAGPTQPPPSPGAAPAAAPEVPLEVLAATGFDIRVKPPATISLDGRVLGKAPLRVRNLTPGPHVIDIEAPAGFFSRRVEIELNAGEPQNVNLALDPIDPNGEASADDARDDDKSRRDRRRSRRKARTSRRSKARQPAEVTEALTLPDDPSSDQPTSPPASSEKGTLMIGSKPPCDIYIDGAATGLKTPQRAIELPPGTHRVTLINTELSIKKNFTVKITAGKSTRAIHDLTSEAGGTL